MGYYLLAIVHWPVANLHSQDRTAESPAKLLGGGGHSTKNYNTTKYNTILPLGPWAVGLDS